MTVNIKMEPILGLSPRTDKWMNNYISPGRVGSVGDVHMQVKLKTSMPDQAQRFSPWTSGLSEKVFGSNVQDGQLKSFDSGGLMARVIDRYWDMNSNFKICNGWIYQDLRAPDRQIEPFLGATPQYSWLNKVATVYNAKSTGNKFLPAPGEYASKPGDVPRGGSVPIRVANDLTYQPNFEKGAYTQPKPKIYS